ncbi:uncharacterized protein BKA78DRAFT_38835 [Phyllosticta capitalensis]|uniref:uncharacterized protein n=1 Tax=Phyllosticta capitalensis TaxID=121624 RepID=UPI00312E2245
MDVGSRDWGRYLLIRPRLRLSRKRNHGELSMVRCSSSAYREMGIKWRRRQREPHGRGGATVLVDVQYRVHYAARATVASGQASLRLEQAAVRSKELMPTNSKHQPFQQTAIVILSQGVVGESCIVSLGERATEPSKQSKKHQPCPGRSASPT